MSRDEIAKGVFGAEARQLAADNQVRLDEASLARVTRELVNVGKAFGELAMRRLSSADHSDEVGQNLPGLLPVSWTPSAAQKGLVSINEPMSGSVKGFGCRPMRMGSDRAEGRRSKASKGGSRGPGL
jgi:hypothetical protein